MNNFILVLVLQVLAVVVVIAEIIIPSGGVLTITAGGLLIYSLYVAFVKISAVAGVWVIVADSFTIPVAVIIGIKLLARSPATLRKSLSRESGVQSQPEELAWYAGMDGTAATDLRPAGKALIGGRRIDVVTRGDYIEAGVAVAVDAVEGNQVIVKRTA